MKLILPIIILLIAGIITAMLVIFKPDAAELTIERPITSIEVIAVRPQSVQLTVSSQGTLLPTIETDLIAEVSGRVIKVSESFRIGNNFRKGDNLIKIDPADYEAAAASARADLADAELALAQEQAQSDQAAVDWQALGDGKPSDLTLRKPQLAQAKARTASAKANLKRAERDLARTEIIAPYDGIVLSKQVDLGQFVIANPSNPLGRVYATGSAEIRLPITEKEATLLDQQTKRRRFVKLTQDTDESTRMAPLVRIEDNVDPSSRLLYAVARIQDPFASTPNQSALRRGTFLQAVIEGRNLSHAYVLPRCALRGSNTVYIVNKSNKLETRKVEIIKSDAMEVIVTAGLEPGERVATSPIAYYIENMTVNIIN